jgi:DNA-binding transcriptional ArsR family regulator
MKDDLAPLWKALSDPTRREILDRLREGPRTTGELAEAFPSTRFAVMKHLEVLVEAGLVVSRKQGRERWNHLNAMPLQALYERWVRPYEAHWAAGLLRLKDLAERPEGEGPMAEDGFGVVHVEMELRIEARPERVWQVLVEETGRWWHKDFYAGANPQGFILEPRLGGRMYEDWGSGSGAIWYLVTEIDPPRSLGLSGHMPAAFGGPATSLVRIVLEEEGGGTLFQLADSEFRKVTEKARASLEEGWRTLFGELKKYVEAGEKA